MLIKSGFDLIVECFDAVVESEDVGGQFTDDRGGKLLARQHDQLGTGCGNGSSCESVVVAYPAVPQPRRQTSLTGSAYLAPDWRKQVNSTTAPLHDL